MRAPKVNYDGVVLWLITRLTGSKSRSTVHVLRFCEPEADTEGHVVFVPPEVNGGGHAFPVPPNGEFWLAGTTGSSRLVSLGVVYGQFREDLASGARLDVSEKLHVALLKMLFS